MELTSLPVRVLPKLAHTTSSITRSGTYPLKQLVLGCRDLKLPGGIDYQFRLTNTGEAVLLTGRACATVLGSCERCLGSAQQTLEGEIEGYYLFAPPDRKAGRDDHAQGHVSAEGFIDVAPEIVAAIVVELPPVLLCATDCTGVMEGPDADFIQGAADDAGDSCSEADHGQAAPINPQFAALEQLRNKLS
ncbi:MAG: DUF177 domain-containing protein [Coriobacteriales bacterium]|jgi:uncharacterized protein|nr:DUF177 domain-containing protein [Coriobacteriales bacterium]